MTGSGDHSKSHGDTLPEGDALESLVARCLLEMEEEGEIALDRLCAEHPEHAQALRQKIGWLSQSGLTSPNPEALNSVGSYELIELLGQGAQGSVYLASDTRLSRKVALKILKPTLFSDDDSVARFRREAEAASRLEHPAVCSVYEFGQADGVFFIAMQFVEGRTLADLIEVLDPSILKKGTSLGELTQTLSYFEGAARALHAAHEAGLLHRDIKPSNLMVTPEGKPMILDFGLARIEESDLPTLTDTGVVMGTPAYMSVEQIQGARGLDRRTDVYSLGVALYEALTGSRPFDGGSRMALFRAITTAPIPDPRRANARVPTDLKVVLETALERVLWRRYPDALTLAEELKRVQERQPIKARSASPLLRGWRWCQRNPALAVAGAMVLAGLGVILTLMEKTATERQGASDRQLGQALASAALDELEGSPDLAILLAIEAARLQPGPQANGALLDSVLNMREQLHLSGSESAESQLPGTPIAARYGPEGERILVRCTGGVACVVDVTSGKIIASLGTPGGARVTAGEWDPSGRRAVIGAADGGVYLWETGSPGLRRIWQGGAIVSTVSYSPTGSRLLVVCGDEVNLLVTGQVEPVAIPTGGVTDAIWRADGQALLLAEADGDLVEVELETLGELWRVDAGKGQFRFPRSGPSGERLLALYYPQKEVGVGRYGTQLHVWSWTDRQPLVQLGVESDIPACFLPSGEEVLVRNYDRSVDLIEINTGQVQLQLRGHEKEVIDVHPSPAGPHALSVSADETVRTWRLGQPPGYPTLRGGSEGITPVSFDPSSSRILAAASDGTAHVWDAHTGQRLLSFPGHEHPVVYPALFSPDGRRVLTACHDGHARIFDSGQGSELLRVGSAAEPLFTADFSPDGTMFATAGVKGSIRVYDVETGQLQAAPEGHKQMITWMAFSPDGRMLATACEDGTAGIWRCEDGELLHRLGGEGQKPTFVHFSPDSQHLLLLTSDGLGHIIEVESGERTCELVGHGEMAWRGDFSPAGDRVATGSRDATVIVWDVASGRMLHRLEGHDSMITDIGYSPDGRQLASVDLSGVIQLWGMPGGELLLSRKTGLGPLYALAFSHDSARLAFSCRDHVQVWPADPLAAAEAMKSRDLRAEEREQFLVQALGE